METFRPELSVSDMDGCLVNKKLVVANLGEAYIAQGQDPTSMFNIVEAYVRRGESYNALSHVEGLSDPSLTEAIKHSFLEICEENPIVYDDAHPYLKFMEDRFISNLILTNGDQTWQELKLEAGDLDQYPYIVINNVSKGNVISSWQNPESGLFSPPTEVLDISTPRLILLEDKLSGFVGFPKVCIGYIVDRDGELVNTIRIDDLRPNIKIVGGLNEILDDIDQRFF
jgi:hypothetical protein